MKNPVVIKSFPNGLSIYLDPEMPFQDLLSEIAEKFRQSADFFKDARMALSFEGRVLSSDEELEIVDVITNNSKLNIVCIVGENDDTNRKYVHAMTKLASLEKATENLGQFYKGTLKDGQNLESTNSLILLGDVYPNCQVRSDKDIIIMGGLYGKAFAGCDGEGGHFVAALVLSPEEMEIDGHVYMPADKQARWGFRPKVVPKLAYVENHSVHTEEITKELLESLPF